MYMYQRLHEVCLLTRCLLTLQYTPSYGYGLSQPPPNATPMATFSQPSMFVAQSDLYTPAAFRSQYQPTPPNTIMVSSSTSSMMSTAIKPPAQQSQYCK